MTSTASKRYAGDHRRANDPGCTPVTTVAVADHVAITGLALSGPRDTRERCVMGPRDPDNQPNAEADVKARCWETTLIAAGLFFGAARQMAAQALGIPDNVRMLARGSEISVDYGMDGNPRLAGFQRSVGVTGTVSFGPVYDGVSRSLRLNVTIARATTRSGSAVTSYGVSVQAGNGLVAGIGYVDSMGLRRIHVPLEFALPLASVSFRPVVIIPWVQVQADYYYVGGGYHFNYPAAGLGIDVDTRSNFGVRWVAQKWNGPVGKIWVTSIGVHWSTHGNARVSAEGSESGGS